MRSDQSQGWPMFAAIQILVVFLPAAPTVRLLEDMVELKVWVQAARGSCASWSPSPWLPLFALLFKSSTPSDTSTDIIIQLSTLHCQIQQLIMSDSNTMLQQQLIAQYNQTQ